VAFEGANALAARRSRWDVARWGGEFPHLDGLVETTADQTISRRSEGDTIDAVPVALLTLEAHDEAARVGVPDTDALVKRSGCHEAAVGRDGYGRDAILDGKVKHLLIGFEIPETNAPVPASGCNNPAVLGEVQAIDILLMAGELMLDGTGVDIPDLVTSVARSSSNARGIEYSP